ncbi:MAG TPA: dihydroorotase [Gammaproteobacteria bacterium]|nr:dihydroorotase [Gammaproteobacteria bacterium]
MVEITLIKPDDWHLHLRDGAVLRDIVPFTTARFARAIVMPNLQPPVTKVSAAVEYRQRILEAVPAGDRFEPLMTLYLTESTPLSEVEAAATSGIIKAFKLYPAGATTNSNAGVKEIKRVYSLLEKMQETGLLLLIHGEVVDSDIDIFDREKIFIDRTLSALVNDFPELKIVFEHITTRDAAQFVRDGSEKLAATLTPQHLMYNRNSLLVGGIKPHYYCLPVLKREAHRAALIESIASGSPKFFLGTDSAPHARHTKENSCGCAGIFSAHAGIELYAEVFEQAGILDKLEGFASCHGPDFYGLPRNQETITLRKETWEPPSSYPFAGQALVPLKAEEAIHWRIV